MVLQRGDRNNIPAAHGAFIAMLVFRMRWQICVVALLLTRMSYASPKVVAVDVDGIVHPVTVEIVSRALEQAKRDNADAVLLRLNTPGGLMDAMRETIEKIVSSPIPVVTYVTPSGGRAASAGFFHARSGRRRGHGARNQYRRGASCRDGRRDGCRDEAEGGERRGRLLRSI